ncbi:two-component sensor histidine kinase [Clostridium sp. W14A]|nr:two-component sensor histidine kinase [Clostridium sp. W14A]
MNWTLFFLVLSCTFGCAVIFLVTRLCRVQEQLNIIENALKDIQTGNLNRRILTRKSDMTKSICYSINEIAANDQAQLIRLKEAEQAYKRLMTGLSHDVKTPLTSLVGYLEAIQGKVVIGEEKEEYIGVALDKAHHLKDFVEDLFEWVKLDAKEQKFQFEDCDLNELSQDILADWIPALEDRKIGYEISIPETEYILRLDRNAYTRILNNLLQNTLVHSEASNVTVSILENDKQALIIVQDNGKGISPKDLPHIFERLYQCDESRTAGGNGLGLSIVKELVMIHGGKIEADSPPEGGAKFTIVFPKAL